MHNMQNECKMICDIYKTMYNNANENAMQLNHDQIMSGSKPHKCQKDDEDAKSVFHRKGAATLKPTYQRGIGAYTCRTMSDVDGHKNK
mgnify:FL=1